MKKISKIISLVLALALVMIFPLSASAKSITSIETDGKGGLSVSGKTEAGMLAAAVAVYDESGKDLVTMVTTDVASDNTFITTVDVPTGTYVVKVADYEGGDFVTATVTVTDADETIANTDELTAKEVAPIIGFVALGLAVVSLAGVVVYKKKQTV